MALATLREVQAFFGMTTRQMRDEWANGGLTDQEKNAIRDGIADGTLTY